jgi:hypothetical protein
MICGKLTYIHNFNIIISALYRYNYADYESAARPKRREWWLSQHRQKHSATAPFGLGWIVQQTVLFGTLMLAQHSTIRAESRHSLRLQRVQWG